MDPLSAVGRRVARAGRAALVAARDGAFPAAACERAAQLAIYVHCEPLAQQRRVLDVCCGRGWGAAHLLAAGATQVTGLEQPALVSRAARRFGRPGLDFESLESLLRDSAIAVELPLFDLVTCTRRSQQLEPLLEAIVDRLAPGSQLVLGTRPGDSANWRDRLRESFLSIECARLCGTSSDNVHLELLSPQDVSPQDVSPQDVSPQDVPAGASTQGMPATDTVLEMVTASAPRRHLPAGPLRLHIGSGSQRIEGWVNVDIRPFPGVDLVADVNRGLDFADVDAVYAEHFLEHLAADDAFVFLAAVHRMLMPEGRLRLSTPNLDWVWRTHYRLEGPSEHKIDNALKINRAFHGWEHKFLWNRETLAAALAAVGFTNLRWYRHGESDDATFRDLERHETYGDSDDLPHVLIVEARRGSSQPETLASLQERLQREFLDHVAGY